MAGFLHRIEISRMLGRLSINSTLIHGTILALEAIINGRILGRYVKKCQWSGLFRIVGSVRCFS